MEMQKISYFGVKGCLTEASLGWKCFRTYNKDRDFYTFDKQIVEDLFRELVKVAKVAALNRLSESNQCERILNTIKKQLKIYDNEILNVVCNFSKHIYSKLSNYKLEFGNGEKDCGKRK